MDFIGSKEKLNSWIFSKILHSKKSLSKYINNPFEVLTFLDGCSGSCSTTIYASNLGIRVISNDILSFSQHIAIGATSISLSNYREAEEYIKEMNNLKPVEGFFFNNYSEKVNRPYFTSSNAGKIDACRLYANKIKNEFVKSYILYCMLKALSRVSNTTGVQAAFLKSFKDRSLQPFVLRCEETSFKNNVIAYNKDIIDLLSDPNFRSKFEEDILYIDPPYNERQYGPNYHLYETLIKYDNPQIRGITGLRDWSYSKSGFCERKSFLELLKKIINKTFAKSIFLSYSSDGLIERYDLEKFILENNLGELSIHLHPKKRYKSDSNRKNNLSFLMEYLLEITRV